MVQALVRCEKCGAETEIGEYVEIHDQHNKVVGRWAMWGRAEDKPGIIVKSVMGVCGRCSGPVSWTPMDRMLERIRAYVVTRTV